MPIKINGSTSGSTTITAPATGTDETIELSTALAAKLPIAGGKILQVVRATDSTDRTTTSGTYVDANISVSITPKYNTSNVLLIWMFGSNAQRSTSGVAIGRFRIVTSAGSSISGEVNTGISSSSTVVWDMNTLIAWASPATTSAVTYKGQFNSADTGTTVAIRNDLQAGQLYAIEVSA